MVLYVIIHPQDGHNGWYGQSILWPWIYHGLPQYTYTNMIHVCFLDQD